MLRSLVMLSLITLTRIAVAADVPPATVRIASGIDGLELFLRHQPREDARASVLVVHGATFPSANAAAWKIAGRSWLDELNTAGFDAWALDFLGYGESDRYPAVQAADAQGEPLGDIASMAAQIDRAVDHIRKANGGTRVDLVAHSAGTLVAARYTQLHGEKIGRLVLFGTPAPLGAAESDASAPVRWFESTRDAQWNAWEAKVRDSGRLDPRMFETWWLAYLASDAQGALRQPPSVRVPAGLSAAIGEVARSGRLPYDPARIERPTLVIQGDWDAVTPPAEGLWVYERIGAAVKRYVIVSRAGHRAHLEASRGQLFREIETFLAGNDGD